MPYKSHSRYLSIFGFILLITLACNLPLLSNDSSKTSIQPVDATQGNTPATNNGAGNENEGKLKAANESGLNRQNPYQIGSLVNIGGWQIEVREFLRGSKAMDVLSATEHQVEAPSEGSEYALARVYVRCVAIDDSAHSLGISDLSITGSSNLIYGDQLDGQPQPEFLYEDMYTAEAVEGWVDAIIPNNEENLMLVVDLNSWDPEARITRYFMLEQGASITPQINGVDKTMNSVGIEISSPAKLNQEMVLKNWGLIAEEIISGEQASDLLQQADPKFSPAEAGWQYTLSKVKVNYFNTDDVPASLQFSHFYAVDQNGDLDLSANRFITIPKGGSQSWVNIRLLPGAVVEGWVIVVAQVDTHPLIIAFDPDEMSFDTTGESKRYIQIMD